MKTYALAVTTSFFVCFLFIFNGAHLPSPVVCSIMSITYIVFRELDFANRLSFCFTPETKEWVKIENMKNLSVTINQFTAVTLFIIIFDGKDGGIFTAFTALLALHCYFQVFHKHTVSDDTLVKYEYLRPSDLNGIEYRLPSWLFLPRTLRRQLLLEAHRKVPSFGETHLFFHKGIFHTKVRVMSPRYRRPCLEKIPDDLLKKLEKYPTRKPESLVIEHISYLLTRSTVLSRA